MPQLWWLRQISGSVFLGPFLVEGRPERLWASLLRISSTHVVTTVFRTGYPVRDVSVPEQDDKQEQQKREASALAGRFQEVHGLAIKGWGGLLDPVRLYRPVGRL